tara:strand:+ start:388 stop:792 length:405 start_codon:yes stop_codon:yes gene_type:complete
MMTKMTSSKPYLIRGLYDWIIENELTPYLLVSAEAKGVQVPFEHVVDGKIVLNISPTACRGLLLENDRIVFTARFSGQATQVFVTPGSVLAIYAKENGRGMEFDEEDDGDIPPPPPSSTQQNSQSKRPSLKLIK